MWQDKRGGRGTVSPETILDENSELFTVKKREEWVLIVAEELRRLVSCDDLGQCDPSDWVVRVSSV